MRVIWRLPVPGSGLLGRASCFEVSRERFAEEFAELNRRIIAELVEKQEFIGAYYEVDGEI